MVGLCYRSKVIGVTLTLLMLATSVMAFGIHPIAVAHALSVIIVPDDYATIQDAIGNATAGDTVYVRAGTYYGGLAINKPLTLEGESNKNTIMLLSYSQSPYPTIGLWIGASNVTVSGFHFVSNASYLVCMIAIDGRSSVANNDVFMDNIVEGKPTLYDYGSGNYEYPDPIVAISSQGDRIVGNTVLPGGSGFGLASTITLDGADNCLVAENNVTEGWVGILVMGNNNIVGLNHVADTTDFNGWQCGGITLDMGTNNTVVGNTLVNNTYGVSSWSSHGNIIYHNNFIENGHQAYSRASSLSTWDDGYPSGGNYWSDYNGTDAFMGQYQNVTGGDGIGDTSMIASSSTIDHYPLMKPVDPIVGDLNLDGKVNVKDIAVVAHSFGLVAGDIRWSPLVDVNEDGKIDIRDMSLIARNFGKSWL